MKSYFYIQSIFWSLLVAANAAKAQQMGLRLSLTPARPMIVMVRFGYLKRSKLLAGLVLVRLGTLRVVALGKMFILKVRRVWRDMRLSATTADHGAEGFDRLLMDDSRGGIWCLALF